MPTPDEERDMSTQTDTYAFYAAYQVAVIRLDDETYSAYCGHCDEWDDPTSSKRIAAVTVRRHVHWHAEQDR
jgi:hypothetical protein